MKEFAEQLLKESERRYRLIRVPCNQFKRYGTLNQIVSRYITMTFVTTGNRPGADRIIQIGAIKYNNGKRIAQFNSLINPKRYVPAKVTKETGIANAFVENAPTMDRKIDELLAFIDDYPIVTTGATTQMAFFYALERQLQEELPFIKVMDLHKMIRKSLPFIKNDTMEQVNMMLMAEQQSKHALERCEKYNDLYELYGKIQATL